MPDIQPGFWRVVSRIDSETCQSISHAAGDAPYVRSKNESQAPSCLQLVTDSAQNLVGGLVLNKHCISATQYIGQVHWFKLNL